MHCRMIANTLDHLKNCKHVLSFQRVYFNFFNRLAGVCKHVGELCSIFLQKLERETTKHAQLKNVTQLADCQTSN